ncbi:hypothetical protein BCR35DRAFT_158772 [Leucosporidium creatinivorum]|uniref:Uncharacterized protein n=1 Tax=Leucosporidium creatinivorum TaxID=106004 RepID=A0A1Y2G066_9BASI|nr:hypothetical protein BCR35DRAFT_158772 [Leucosporidium creatinivorum]
MSSSSPWQKAQISLGAVSPSTRKLSTSRPAPRHISRQVSGDRAKQPVAASSRLFIEQRSRTSSLYSGTRNPDTPSSILCFGESYLALPFPSIAANVLILQRHQAPLARHLQRHLAQLSLHRLPQHLSIHPRRSAQVPSLRSRVGSGSEEEAELLPS